MQTGFELDYIPALSKKSDYGIGIVGAGFIVQGCHLPAYKEAGYKVLGITSRTVEKARLLAAEYEIPNVYDSLEEMLENPDIDIIDIAYPPHKQVEIVKQVARHGKHILVQKPIAMDYSQTKELAEVCKETGVKILVNQNGRFDPTIQATKNLLDQGLIGKPVMATIELRYKPHWQSFILDYDRLMFLNMSIHHLDQFRFLFGTPDRIYAHGIPVPDMGYKGEYLGAYILEYDKGMIASAWDDGFTWDPPSYGVFYKIEGTEGVVKLNIGWPSGGPSEMTFYSKKLGDTWFTPNLEGSWFPGAFKYTMNELFKAIESGEESDISVESNLTTMAMVEACYLSNQQKKAVSINDILVEQARL